MQRSSPDIPPAFSLKDLLPVLAIVVLAAILYYPLFLGHPIMPDTWERFEPWNTDLGYDGPTDERISNANNDAILLYIPWNKFAHDELNAGRIPAWDPNSLCGVPLVANHLVPVFYPVYALIAWLASPLFIIGISGLIHTMIMGMFFYLFLKEWLGNRTAAWAAASFLVVSLLPNPHYQPWPMTMAWFPAIWFFYERWLKHRNPWAGLWMALCWACPLLSGYPSLFIQLSLFTGVWFLIRPTMMPVENRPPVLSRILILALPFILALGISAVQNIPTMLASAGSDRTFFKSSEELAREASFTIPPNQPWQMHVKRLLQPFVPFKFANNDFFNRGYVGILPFALAMFSLAWIKRRDYPRAVFYLALIIAPFALIPPLNFLIYQWTRGVLIDPNPPLEVFGFLLLMISAFGITIILKDRDPDKATIEQKSGVATALLVIIINLAIVHYKSGSVIYSSNFILIYFLMIWVVFLTWFARNSKQYVAPILIFLIVIFSPFMVSTQSPAFTDYRNHGTNNIMFESEAISAIRDLTDPSRGGEWGRIIRHSSAPVNVMSLTDQPYTFYPNLGTYFGIPDAFGYHNLAPKSRFDFFRDLQHRAVIEHRGIVAFDSLYDTWPPIYHNSELLAARYWLSDSKMFDLELVYSQDNFYIYETGIENISRFKIAGEGYHLPPNENPDWAAEPVIITDDPGHAVVNVSCEQNAVLYFYEGYANGWIASIDDNPVDLGTIDGMVMFVSVPPDDHTIEFRYIMPGLQSGLSVTTISLILWLILGSVISINSKRKSEKKKRVEKTSRKNE